MHSPLRDMQTRTFALAMRQELLRRLDTIHGYPSDVFGTVTRREIGLAAVMAAGLPFLVWSLLT